MPTGHATSHHLDLFSLPELSPLAQKAPQLQSSQSSSFPGWRPPTQPPLQTAFPDPRGRQEPHSQEGLTQGQGGHCTQPTGSFWGGTRPKKGRARVKLFCPQKTSFQWRSLMRAITHARPNSPPSGITMAIVKAVTPRKLASDVPTQGFPPNIFLSKGHITSTLLLASRVSHLTAPEGGRPGFSSFPRRGSPSFGEGSRQAGTLWPLPTPS